MSRTVTKAAGNIYCNARLDAAQGNDSLRSRDGASEVLGIEISRLARIELGAVRPHPDEIVMMMEVYNAPELGNYYCSRECELGCKTIPVCQLKEFDRVMLQAVAALADAGDVQHSLVEISADGEIDESEVNKLRRVLKSLDRIERASQEIRLWVRKYLGELA